MLKNHVNGCHGNHAIFQNVIESIVEKKIISISVVPINDLAPMKNCLGVQRYIKLAPGLPRLWAVIEEEKTYAQRTHDRTHDRIKQSPLTHRLNSSIVCISRCISYTFFAK